MLIKHAINCLENHGIKWQLRNDKLFCIDSWVDTKDEKYHEMWIQAPTTINEMMEFLQY